MTSANHQAQTGDGIAAKSLSLTRRLLAAGIALAAGELLLGESMEEAEARHRHASRRRRRRRRKKGRGTAAGLSELLYTIRNFGGTIAVEVWVGTAPYRWTPSETRTLEQYWEFNYYTSSQYVAAITTSNIYVEIDFPVNAPPNGTIATNAFMTRGGYVGTALVDHQTFSSSDPDHTEISAGGIRFASDLGIFLIDLP